jgi:hypothetical protein
MGANLMFYVAPPAENWVSHFDNTELKAWYDGVWTGSAWWDEGGGSIEIRNDGSPSPEWADAYRPTHIRFTFTGVATLTSVSIRDKWSSEMTEALEYVSGEPIEIIWAGTDGFEIVLYEGITGDFYITNIEFLEPIV